MIRVAPQDARRHELGRSGKKLDQSGKNGVVRPIWGPRSDPEHTPIADEAHAEMREAMNHTNEAGDGSYRVTWDFLLSVGTKAG